MVGVLSRVGLTRPMRTHPDEPTVVARRLPVRLPFDGAGLAAWFGARAIAGCEAVDGEHWRRAVRLAHGAAIISADLGAGIDRGGLPVTLRLADPRDLDTGLTLVRSLLDLDADPVGIDAHLSEAIPLLAPLVAARPGVRLPGTPSLAEALMWAIVGQQITATQARDQIARATDLLAEPLPASLRDDHLTRLPADPVIATARADAWFRGPTARRRALIEAIAAAPDSSAADIGSLRDALLALRGIGPWTADYALLRGAHAVNLAPSRDAALLAAARDLGLADTHDELDRALAPAAPWRSYAVMHLWHHAAALPRPLRRRPAPPSIKESS